MFVPLFVTLLLLHNICAYIEIVPISGCGDCDVRLTCRHLDATIAILEAKFEPFENATLQPESSPLLEELFLPIQPRVALNHRCSGKNHCSFNFSQDCPGADRYGNGNLSVLYACATERRVSKFCNREFELPTRGIAEGFVQSPGYPRFYLGQHECWWRFKSPPGQRVRITLLDISLQSGGPSSTTCPDYVTVRDNPDRDLYSTCIQHDKAIELTSSENTIEVSLMSSSRGVVARRGLLFSYTSVGCRTPEPPRDGYLVHRNGTAAEYMCCVGYEFPDTGARDRTLTCKGHQWDSQLPLPDCYRSFKQRRNYTGNFTQEPFGPVSDSEMRDDTFRDIIVPSIIIVTLFAVNTIVVLTIHVLKKRRALKEQDEEMGAMMDHTDAPCTTQTATELNGNGNA